MWRGKKNECSSKSEFIQPIRKASITAFPSKNFERKNKSKGVAELQVTKGTRDFFGSLLILSGTNGIDLESIFSFFILPESACFAYPDGKSTVFHHLNKDSQSDPWDVHFKFKLSKPS